MRVSIITCAVVAAATAASAQETRELDAHEHGHGRLGIAVEGGAVAMELEAPGFDVVGFEHAAESAEDRAAVEDAVAQLARPVDLFSLPDGAGCRVTEASVELHGAQHDGQTGHEHAEDKEHGEEHAEGEEHSEFRATYRFACDDVDALTTIGFPYFEIFPNAEELEVQMVTDEGASVTTIGRDTPTLDLAGAM